MSEKINPLARKCCKKCGVEIGSHYNLAQYCDECDKQLNQEKQKNEEIKQMAWEIYTDQVCEYPYTSKNACEDIAKCAWRQAETFYNMAKEKEEGACEDKVKDEISTDNNYASAGYVGKQLFSQGEEEADEKEVWEEHELFRWSEVMVDGQTNFSLIIPVKNPDQASFCVNGQNRKYKRDWIIDIENNQLIWKNHSFKLKAGDKILLTDEEGRKAL